MKRRSFVWRSTGYRTLLSAEGKLSVEASVMFSSGDT